MNDNRRAATLVAACHSALATVAGRTTFKRGAQHHATFSTKLSADVVIEAPLSHSGGRRFDYVSGNQGWARVRRSAVRAFVPSGALTLPLHGVYRTYR